MRKILTLSAALCLVCACFTSALCADMQTLKTLIKEGDLSGLETALKSPEAGELLQQGDAEGHTLLDYAIENAPAVLAFDIVNNLRACSAEVGKGEASPELAVARMAVDPLLREKADAVIDRIQQPDKPFANGLTPFLWAAAYGNVDLLEKLVRHGSVIGQTMPSDSPENGGDNALFAAARQNSDGAVIRWFVSKGFDVNKSSSFLGQTPLMLACRFNISINPAMELVNAGADINARDGVSYSAFLGAATRNEGPRLLKLLVEKGADIHASDDGGFGALHQAAAYSLSDETVKYLLSLGLPVNETTGEDSDSLTPYMLAVRFSENPRIIRVLAEAGAKRDMRDGNGKLAWEGIDPQRRAWLDSNGLAPLLWGGAAPQQKRQPSSGRTAVVQGRAPAAGLPAPEFVVHASAGGERIVEVRINGAKVQTLRDSAEEEIPAQIPVRQEDFNFDGFLDVAFYRSSHSGNERDSIWLYTPDAEKGGIYVRNRELSRYANLVPDAARQAVVGTYHVGGDEYAETLWRWRDGRVVKTLAAYVLRGENGEEVLRAPSLCVGDGESEIFTGATENGKILSLCKKLDENGTATQISYRFGREEKIEMDMPVEVQNSAKRLAVGSLSYSGGGGHYMRFSRGNTDYVVYEAQGKGWQQAGVSVLGSGKVLADIVCRPGAYVSRAHFPTLAEILGIAEDSREFEINVREQGK